MKKLIFISILFSIVSCNQKKIVSDKEKHDLVKNGMNMKEVMDIYGLKDTINHSLKIGECGYEFDSLKHEMVVGPNGISPVIRLTVDSNFYFDFIKGKVVNKISFDEIEKQKADTGLQRILKELK